MVRNLIAGSCRATNIVNHTSGQSGGRHDEQSSSQRLECTEGAGGAPADGKGACKGRHANGVPQAHACTNAWAGPLLPSCAAVCDTSWQQHAYPQPHGSFAVEALTSQLVVGCLPAVHAHREKRVHQHRMWLQAEPAVQAATQAHKGSQDRLRSQLKEGREGVGTPPGVWQRACNVGKKRAR